jgi:tetratricopeptide (TPR) repeat protein
LIAKKIFVAALFLLALAMPLFAYTDTFKSTTEDPEYVALITALKNGEDESTVLGAYNAYLDSDISPVERCRVEYHMARYYKDKNNKSEGKAHIETMKRLYDELLSSITPFERLVCETELTSAEYYVTRKLSVGMDNSDLAKKLYKEYPEEVFAIMNEVWRLIYTPAIAGGSTKKALNLLDDLTTGYNELADIDRYSILCAYAIAYNARGDYKKANEYFEEAFKYFVAEADVVETYKSNLEKLSE